MGIIWYLVLWSFYVPAFEGGQYQSLERCEAAAEMNLIGLEARYGKLQWRCEAHRGDADAPPVRLRSVPPPPPPPIIVHFTPPAVLLRGAASPIERVKGLALSGMRQKRDTGQSEAHGAGTHTSQLVLAQLIDCHPSYPGRIAQRWSWQTIDGHKCHYPGPPKISKKRLRWPESIPFLIIEPDPPQADDRGNEDQFMLRWKGER